MARSFSRTATSIWQDADWVALSGDAQRAYMLLTSQSKLSLVGCMDYKPTRWASLCADWTIDTFDAAMGELEAAGYVAVDLVTDEVLVCSFTRDDGITPTNKNLRKGVWTALGAVDSPILRAVAVENMPDALFEHGDVPDDVQHLREHPSEPAYEPAFQPPSESASEPASELPPSPPQPSPSPEAAATVAVTADQRRQRLDEACAVLTDRHLERFPSNGNPVRHRAAVHSGKMTDHADTAYRLLADIPDLDAVELADRLEPAAAPAAAAPEARNTSSHIAAAHEVVGRIVPLDERRANAPDFATLRAVARVPTEEGA